MAWRPEDDRIEDGGLPAGDPDRGLGRRAAPDAVWAAVRDDYLAGLSAPECCRRHGVGLTALRRRAGLEGWRRADQPWTPPDRLDPWDEGAALEDEVGGDLDHVEARQLAYVARRRMMRAVLRGDAMEALPWRRVRLVMDEEEAEMARLIAQEEALWFQRFGHGRTEDGEGDGDGCGEIAAPATQATDATAATGATAAHGVFTDRPDRPEDRAD